MPTPAAADTSLRAGAGRCSAYSISVTGSTRTSRDWSRCATAGQLTYLVHEGSIETKAQLAEATRPSWFARRGNDTDEQKSGH